MTKEYHKPNEGCDIEDYMIQVIDGELFIRNDHYDKDQGKIKVDQFEVWMLGESIQVRNTTYGQFWSLIEPHMNIWNGIFKAATYGNDLNAWVGQMDKPYKKDDCKIDYIYVSRLLEKNEFEGDVTLEVSSDFGGYGMSENMNGDGEYPTSFGIEFGLQSFAKDLPFYIDESFNIWDETLPIDQNTSVEEYYIDRGARQTWTLWDVLNTIFFEITFNGSPEQGEELMDDLNKMVEQYKNGDLETYHIEDLFE